MWVEVAWKRLLLKAHLWLIMEQVVTKDYVERHHVLLKDFSPSERHISYWEWDLTVNFLACMGSYLIPHRFCLRCPVPSFLTMLPAHRGPLWQGTLSMGTFTWDMGPGTHVNLSHVTTFQCVVDVLQPGIPVHKVAHWEENNLRDLQLLSPIHMHFHAKWSQLASEIQKNPHLLVLPCTLVFRQCMVTTGLAVWLRLQNMHQRYWSPVTSRACAFAVPLPVFDHWVAPTI